VSTALNEQGKKMPVSFCEQAIVIEFADCEDSKVARKSIDGNLEYRREQRLFTMVLAWKQRNPVAASAALKTLQDLLGRKRAKVARTKLKCCSLEDLQQFVTRAVLEKWDFTGDDAPRHRSSFDISTVITLSLVGEVLCQSFRFNLCEKLEQDALFHNIYFFSHHILRNHSQ